MFPNTIKSCHTQRKSKRTKKTDLLMMNLKNKVSRIVLRLIIELIYLLCLGLQYLMGTRNRVTTERIHINTQQRSSCSNKNHHTSNRCFKLVHLTDFHCDELLSVSEKEGQHWYCMFWYQRTSQQLLESVIEQIMAEKPQLLVITGDLIQWQPEAIHFFKIRFLEPLLERCQIPFGIYVTIGNHDIKLSHSKELIRNVLASVPNVHILEKKKNSEPNTGYDAAMKVIHDREGTGKHIEFIGLPDYHDTTFHEQYRHIESKFKHQTQDRDSTIRVILSHNPDSVRLLLKDNWYFDLVLCGHTHGSQICIPFPFISNRVRRWLYRESNNHPNASYTTQILDHSCYIPLHPILIKLYNKLPLSAHVRRRFLKNKLMQKLLCVIKYWEWGKGLCRLIPKDDTSHHDSLNGGGGMKYLYTSRGLATHPPFRLFCPPELTVITLE